MIHKVIGETVNINNTTGLLEGSLFSIYNSAANDVAFITNTTTGFTIPVGPTERIFFEKGATDTISVNQVNFPVYATPVAYKS